MKSTLNSTAYTAKVFCRDSLLWLLAFMCCLIPLRVSASPADGLTDLTITYEDEEVVIEDAPFSLYLVAEVENDGSVELAESFSDVRITGVNSAIEDDLSETNWAELASTFESYILVEEAEGKYIAPVAEGETDGEGELTFEDLESGIYLITGDSCEAHGEVYTPTAVLISLPYVQNDGTVNYAPEILPKFSVSANSAPSNNPQTTEIHVQKIWKDDNSTSRPAEVTVMLFKDGEKYDEVKLNVDNSWYHTWKNLDKNSRWQLGEVSVPTGYTVLTELEGSTFVVVNTLETPTPTPTRPHYPHSGRPPASSETTTQITTEVTTEVNSESPSEVTSKADNPPIADDDLPPFITSEVSEDNPEIPSEDEFVTVGTPQDDTDLSNETPIVSRPTLPQTGQLWWPVPLLAFGGLVAYLVGKRLNNGLNKSKTGAGSDDEK